MDYIGEYYRGLYREVLQGLLGVMLGVKMTAHIASGLAGFRVSGSCFSEW